jgi:hypothetical protein
LNWNDIKNGLLTPAERKAMARGRVLYLYPDRDSIPLDTD